MSKVRVAMPRVKREVKIDIKFDGEKFNIKSNDDIILNIAQIIAKLLGVHVQVEKTDKNESG